MAKKGKLTHEQKTWIVQRLACYASPTEVQAELRTEFRIELGLPSILYYDATARGTDLGKEWRELFAETRASYERDVDSVALSHQAFRLRELLHLYQADKKRGATTLAAQHLAQAAKEMGDFYVNRKGVGATDPATELASMLGITKDDVLAAAGLVAPPPHLRMIS